MYPPTRRFRISRRLRPLPTHPTTHVRLNKQTAHSIADKIEDWAAKLQRAGELGEYTITENDTAWYKASLYSEEEAVSAYQRVVELLRKVLPATREQVAQYGTDLRIPDSHDRAGVEPSGHGAEEPAPCA